MPLRRERGRPVKAAPAVSTAISTEAHDNSAELALRCAWLRFHAKFMHEVDPSGQLTANLLDFADLLEVAQQRRWFR